MSNTIVTSGVTSTANTITSGNTLTVSAGGTEVTGLILSGGIGTILGIDQRTTIALGGTETVSGTAIGDIVGGTQILAGGSVSNDLVSGGVLAISGSDLGATSITITAGGSVQLQSAKAHVNGTLVFAGAGTLAETAVVSSGSGGDLALISGFGLGDVIDLTAIGTGAALTATTSGGNTILTVTGGSAETGGNTVFTLSGTGTAFTLLPDNSGAGSDIVLAAAVTTIAAGQSAPAGDSIAAGYFLDVLSGGSAAGVTVLSGGTADFSGTDSNAVISSGGAANLFSTGLETGATILAGGFETVLGTASGDSLYGTQLENSAAALISNETIYNGGALDMYATSGHAATITVESGGALLLSANAPVNNLTIAGGTALLESKKSNITGSIDFVGAGTINESAVISAGFGVLGVISGFGLGDVLDLSGIGAGASLAITTTGGETVLTVSGGAAEGAGVTETFTFAGTGEYLSFITDPTGTGSEITVAQTVVIAAGSSTTSGLVISGQTLTVQAGGSATAMTVAAGGSAVIAGSDAGSTIIGTETVTGSASANIISGTQNVTGTVSGETVAAGGTVTVQTGGTAANMLLQGGTLQVSGATATLTGGLTFGTSGALVESSVITTGYGDGAVISGFGAGDVIDLSAIGAGAVVSTTTSGGNTVVSISGGSTQGGAVEMFTFSGTGEIYALGTDAAGTGETLTANNPIITVAAGQTVSGNVISAGYQLQVASGGSVANTSILSGGSAVVSGIESGTTIAFGGTETVFGASSGDKIAGAQTVSGTVTGETINGGAVAVASGGTAGNIVLNGGTITVAGSLGGGLTFTGGTLVVAPSAAVTAVISGFAAGDTIDLANIGTGAFTSASVVNGNTVLTISGGSAEGGAVETLTFSGSGNVYALNTDAAGTGESVTAIPIITSFTAGDLVVGVVGDDNDSGYYGDNQAAPIALEEIDPLTGQIIGEMILPQTASGNNSAISGEYGSSSEGILQLAGNGQSLVIAGYGVNAATFNGAPVSVYGTAALAQSTSLTDGAYTPVARVIADISYNGTVDTSTALYNVFNTNNPRSVTTVNGQTFYISGQGVKGDTTQGVFVAQDGASAATAIDTASDTRTVEIYNGQLYVSQNSSTGTANIETFGTLPTGPTAPVILSGINLTVTLTAAEANTINAGAVGTAVALSPEQYFFANATTLYIADGGQPKAGTIGDGGLQKWILNTSTGVWSLAYTLSAGLNLVQNTSVSSDVAGTTGLIGLTGVLNANGTVTFYATNATIGDLDQTYLYTITDNVAASTAAAGEKFTIVTTAASDTNDRGIALAPSAPTKITVAAGVTSGGLAVTNGSTLTVQAGGTVSGAVINSGAAAYVAGQDVGSLIVLGGAESVIGNATGDNVYGVQAVTGGVNNETVYYDGEVLVASGGTAARITMQTGSELVDDGSVSGLVISGGIAVLANAGAQISGVTFAGPGEIAVLTSGAAINGVISGFGVGDTIDLTQFGSGAVLTSSVGGNKTIETVTSGGVSASFTLAGQFAPGALSLAPDASGGVQLAIQGGTVTGTEEVTAGEFGALLTVASGASLTVDADATVTQNLILSGGAALIAGTASNDVVSGGETIASGGTVTGESLTGGTLLMETGAAASNIAASTGTIILDAGANLTGGLALGTDVTVDLAAGASLTAVISGFAGADAIFLAGFGAGAVLTSSVVHGNTVETVTSGGVTETVTLAGTYAAGYAVLETGASGDLLVTKAPIANGYVVTSAAAQGVSGGFYTGPVSPDGLVISSGNILDDQAGGTVAAPVVLSGGVADILGVETGAVISAGGSIVISAGGLETGATILAGGTETLIGLATATGDQIYGLQQVTNANSATGTTLSGETIFNGGTVALLYKTNILEDSTILAGGQFIISGNATGQDLTLAGGTITLESPKANLTNTLDFNSGTLLETAVISSGFGDLAVISGFNDAGVIDLSAIGAGAVLTTSNVGGDVIVTIAGGASESIAQIFAFAGTTEFALVQTAGGAELLGDTLIISAGQSAAGGVIRAGYEVIVLSGGTDTGSRILAGGSETVQTGGTLYITSASTAGLTLQSGVTEIIAGGATVNAVSIASGNTLIVDGTAGGANVAGTEIIAAGGIDTGSNILAGGNETVLSGGTIFISAATETGLTLESGATEVIAAGVSVNGATVASGVTLLVDGIVSGTNVAGSETIGAGGVDLGGTILAGGAETVVSGGTVFITAATQTGLTLESGATEIIAAGVSVNGATVASGVTLLVDGTVSGTNVAGSEIIASGGIDLGGTILAGGAETVLSGGTVYLSSGDNAGLTLASGATEIIASGVMASSAAVPAGVTLVVDGTVSAALVSGHEIITSGGVDLGGTILAGGSETVEAGGTIYVSAAETNGLTLASGATEIVGFGITVSDAAVAAGVTLIVGGTVSGTTDGGVEMIASGGVDSGGTLVGGGSETVQSGGTIYLTPTNETGVTLESGSTEIVASGVAIAAAAVPAGVTLIVDGTVSGVTVGSGAQEIIEAGGVDRGGRTILSGGSETVQAGGTIYIFEGVVSGLTVNSGGTEIIGAGVRINKGPAIGNGVTLVVDGIVSSATVMAGGREIIAAGGVDSGGTILTGGSETVQAGGTVYLTSGNGAGLTVESGGAEIIAAGVKVNGATVAAGVSLVVDGTVSGATVSSGGSELVASGGVDSGGTILAGGSVTVLKGGKVYLSTSGSAGLTLESGSTEIVGAGVAIAGASAAAGVELLVSGIVSGAVISSGGTEVIGSGGVDEGGTILAGGTETVQKGGTIYLTSGVNPGLTLQTGSTAIIATGITVAAAAVGSGVTLDVLGTASATSIAKGGTLVVSSGGVASGTVIMSGGREIVLSGGTTTITSGTNPGLTVSSGGTEIIGAGVTVTGASIAAGVTLNVQGTASASVVNKGAMEFIAGGGTLINGKVLSGGVATISSGGAIAGALTLNGGTALLYGSAAAGAVVTMAGKGATLELGNLGFTGVISSFGAGDKIDFLTLPYSHGASLSFVESASRQSGVLTITDGGQQTSLTFKGNYTTGSFVLSNGPLGALTLASTSGGAG
jgi:autotransporter passenger strand-loop-strand repeat protein